MSKIRMLVAAMAIAVGLAGLQTQSVSAAQTESESVMTFAYKQLDKPFKLGANGLTKYDCSGLVFRTFAEQDLLTKIGGNRTANRYYKWFKSRGQITSKPKPGDLVVWAKRGRKVSHIGIFKGYNKRGQAVAVSALTNGVAVHRVHRINKPFKAYLRVNIER